MSDFDKDKALAEMAQLDRWVKEALEAKDRRIAELEALCEFHINEAKKADDLLLKENKKLRQRVTESEARLEEIAACDSLVDDPAPIARKALAALQEVSYE